MKAVASKKQDEGLVVFEKAVTVARGEALSAKGLLDHAESFRIRSGDEYVLGADWLKRIKAKAKEVEGLRVTLVGPLNGVIKSINELFGGPLATLKIAEGMMKGRLLAWDEAEQARIRREKAEADAAAAKEEARLQKLAQARADRAEAKGQFDKAEEIRENLPTVVAKELVPVEVPKVAGLRKSLTWKCEVVDFELLVKAVVAGEAPMAALLPNEKYLGSMAREYREELRWPGLRVWSETGLASGSE